jgi:hypothetical protein
MTRRFSALTIVEPVSDPVPQEGKVYEGAGILTQNSSYDLVIVTHPVVSQRAYIARYRFRFFELGTSFEMKEAEFIYSFAWDGSSWVVPFGPAVDWGTNTSGYSGGHSMNPTTFGTLEWHLKITGKSTVADVLVWWRVTVEGGIDNAQLTLPTG